MCSTKTFLISTTTETFDGREDIYREVEGACNVVIYSIAKKEKKCYEKNPGLNCFSLAPVFSLHYNFQEFSPVQILLCRSLIKL